MGLGDLVKVPFAFLAINLSPRQHARRARQNGIITPAAIWHAFTQRRARRERSFTTYATWRARMDDYDPLLQANQGPHGLNVVAQAEWNLYLAPGTAFDGLINTIFANNPGLTVTLIVHKSDMNRLKRIEAQPAGGQVAILWSDA
jgi:hypothetical protein